MITWINFLHFYQPSTSSPETIHEVVKSCYQSWVDFLKQHKNAKVTINLTGCLTEQLYNLGYKQLLKDLSQLAVWKQIELVESAAFHPILPLLPKKEIVKQIQTNHDINKKRLGKVYQPKGFFLPEMAYSPAVGKIIAKLGYKYILLDRIAFNGKFVTPSFSSDIKYKIKNTNLNVIFRDRKISQTFVPETIVNLLDEQKKIPHYLITATDGELYGHRYWNWWPAYTEALKHSNTKTLTEYLSSLKKEETVEPVACSWESTPDELKNKIYYALWHNPNNKIHQHLWQLADFALKLNWAKQKDSNYYAARLHLEKGLASCTFWWASSQDFKKLLATKAWNPSVVEAGAQELLNSVRALTTVTLQDKLKAEKIFSQVRDLIWQKHWQQ